MQASICIQCISESESRLMPGGSVRGPASVQIELGADDDLDLLVERAGASQAELVDVPVYADDGLLGEHFLIQKFHAASDSH